MQLVLLSNSVVIMMIIIMINVMGNMMNDVIVIQSQHCHFYVIITCLPLNDLGAKYRLKTKTISLRVSLSPQGLMVFVKKDDRLFKIFTTMGPTSSILIISNALKPVGRAVSNCC